MRDENNRVNLALQNIAYGLFYHEHNKRFKGEIKIINDLAYTKEKNHNSFIRLLELSFAKDVSKKSLKGNNPDVFTYQFVPPDKYGLTGLKMRFYSGINVYASLIPKGTEIPFSLGHELMNSGIKTTFEFDDENVEFN